MRKIKIIPDAPFSTNCDVAVMDVTEGKEKKRCKIKIEYAEADVERMKAKGPSKEDVLAGYKEQIYNVVKYYISGDWECMDDYEAILKIIDEKITPYF
ncbi:hypothetical protein Ami103574_13150 [Aminipila butyrica]|uniref:Uncharacterized protein n=1 Tax=Aminipila butyrica TaxID=433296 RepID=A0A858BY93_9FIRM|nr:hypothetical protein [Aminipila butyrica]QIB70179.1 hypothetical protein Ami103574_13150 [Aminipila butyrica]